METSFFVNPLLIIYTPLEKPSAPLTAFHCSENRVKLLPAAGHQNREQGMNLIELIAPCHFGLEAVLKREILDLGYEISRVEDGKVTFFGDFEAVCYGNVFLRTAERVLLKVGSFRAETFDDLFEGVKALPWENYIPSDGKFWVAKANSVRSKLFSPSDIQSIIKKAMVERLKTVYHKEWFEETGASYPLRVTIMKDEVTIGLDTSGVSLHKRGYRKQTSRAPITETLAAALILLTPWKADRSFIDPFCGSGTFPVEAAMIAADMAPGMYRTFQAQAWTNRIPGRMWDNAFEEAKDRVSLSVRTDIQGYDIDDNVIRLARSNADRFGLTPMIHLQTRPVSALRHSGKYGFLITNPPYGERIEEKKDLPELYREIGDAFRRLETWSKYLITAYDQAERDMGMIAAKNRKIYNGMMKTYFYMFPGPKPPAGKNRDKA